MTDFCRAIPAHDTRHHMSTNNMQSETADFASGPATWQNERNMCVVFYSDLFPLLYENVTSSTKPEIHSLSHYRQRRTELRLQVTCTVTIYLHFLLYLLNIWIFNSPSKCSNVSKVRCLMSYAFCSKFLTLSAVQNFWKSVKIWQSYREFKGGNILRRSVVSRKSC